MATGNDALLVQYRVISERRLHFGRMFWQNIAFVLAMLLLGGVVLRDAGSGRLPWLALAAGMVLILTGFIVHRIRQIEDDCEGLMRTIEERLVASGCTDCVVAPLSRRFGARFAVTLCLVLVGAGLVLLGLRDLLG